MNTRIRVKFWAAITLLILLVTIQAGASLYAVWLHQQQTRDVTWRVNVLPVAVKLSKKVADLQIIHGELVGIRSTRQPFSPWTGNEFRPFLEAKFSQTLMGLKQNYEEYRLLLEDRVEDIGLRNSFDKEFTTVHNIRASIQKLDNSVQQHGWSGWEFGLEKVESQLKTLQQHTEELPDYLVDELNWYSQTMLRHSIWLKAFVIICVTVSVGLMLLLIAGSFRWIFKPLHVLIEGSRQVASGKYGYRIALPTNDEIGELAEAMNFMTERFEKNVRQLEESRRDLDEKVKEKSRELVKTERLASVGFLAAGVAHEINNPLMAISACAESLQRRMEMVSTKNAATSDDIDYVKRYLTMIQEESFRCKGITEKLLGLARKETKTRTLTDFVPIVTDMLDLLLQQNSYKKKNITLDLPEKLEVTVNAQEMKQVVLNLLTNAFQESDEEGQVIVRLCVQGEDEKSKMAMFSVQDDGAGMSAEVIQNVFEPFFTHQKSGGGTGLGLSITHRIIEEHQGRISAYSEGTDKGAMFVVELPMK